MSLWKFAGIRRKTFARGATGVGATLLTLMASGCVPSHVTEPQCHPFNAWLTQKKDEDLPVLLSKDQISEIDDLVYTMMANPGPPHEVPGCGIAITRNDEIAALLTYGYSRMSPEPLPFDLGTLSGIGSVSKTYTALATLKLMDEGKIPYPGLNAQDYLVTNGKVPWSGALVIDLLSHTAGLRAKPKWDETRFHSLETIESYFPDEFSPSLKPSLVAEGFIYNDANVYTKPAFGNPAEPHYSNTGYTILGAIVETISQKLSPDEHGYENYVWQHVARGNALTEPSSPAMCMGAGFREKDMPTLADGHDVDGTRANMSDSDVTGWGWAGPAGGWWTTTGDLARLMLVMQSDAVIPQSYVQTLMRKDNGLLTPDKGINSLRIGMGLELSPKSEPRDWYGKGGDIVGYTAGFRIWPADQNQDPANWGVAFMCNRVGAGSVGDGTHILDAIYEVLHRPINGTHQVGLEATDTDIAKIALSSYASPEGRMDTAAFQRLEHDLKRLPYGREILDSVRRQDWARLETLTRRQLRLPPKPRSP